MRAERSLETFLSGMETHPEPHGVAIQQHLETFLSGMETRKAIFEPVDGFYALKPSLVEWKQVRATGTVLVLRLP